MTILTKEDTKPRHAFLNPFLISWLWKIKMIFNQNNQLSTNLRSVHMYEKIYHLNMLIFMML